MTRAQRYRKAADIIENDLPWEAECRGAWKEPWLSLEEALAKNTNIRIKPKEESGIIPLSQMDWIVGGPWFLRPDKEPFAIQLVTISSPEVIGFYNNTMTHEEAMAYWRSNDGVNWSHCYKRSNGELMPSGPFPKF
jgi:hypothetical protein